jgi:hypothetical protein
VVRAVAGRICAKRATRRRRTRNRNDDDKKQTKTQNQKKKKNADQKENPVVGGYFIVLITSGSIQRVLNRLFVRRCERKFVVVANEIAGFGGLEFFFPLSCYLE